jgi:hypothetical protein
LATGYIACLIQWGGGGFYSFKLGCVAAFGSEAKKEIKASISFCLAVKKVFFRSFRFEAKQQKSEAKTNGK